MAIKLTEISKYLNFAKKLINVSEQIIKKNSPQKLKVNFKYDKSPVTKIDTEIEKKLRSLIKSKYPTHGIYGEEFTNNKISSPYVWVIDPIDGTKNFINGNGSYGTLISLCRDGSPVFGIINSPDIKKRWIGIKDNGAYCNGKKLKKSNLELSLNCLLYTSPSPRDRSISRMPSSA